MTGVSGPVKGTNPERAAARRLARRRELEALACEEDELSLLEVLVVYKGVLGRLAASCSDSHLGSVCGR